jgi:hypothetical protein
MVNLRLLRQSGGSFLRKMLFQKVVALAGMSPCPVVEVTKIAREH